jgi:hypothetical protein
VPMLLSGVDDLVALCGRLTPPERLRVRGDRVAQGELLAAHAAAREEAIVGRYTIVVPARQIPFSPYDGGERTLSVAGTPAVTLGAGKVRLWATEDRALPVKLDAESARHVLAAQRAGTLSLALVFDLPDDATCGGDTRGKRYALGVEPVEWTWLENGAPLARGGVSGDRPGVTTAQGAQPLVDVGEPVSGSADARKAVLAYGGELLGCYQRALQREPELDGLVVVDLGPKVAVTADSTGSAELTGCVEQTLAPLVAASRSSVPIRFELALPGPGALVVPAPGAAEGAVVQ